MILDIISVTLHNTKHDYDDYALDNYLEVIDWYKLPFYKKWFIKKPMCKYYIKTKKP